MREVFLKAIEFIEYHSSKYLLLFGSGILKITQETYNKLKNCYEDSMVLFLIVSPKEFIRWRNNMITIVYNLDSEQIKIDISNWIMKKWSWLNIVILSM